MFFFIFTGVFIYNYFEHGNIVALIVQLISLIFVYLIYRFGFNDLYIKNKIGLKKDLKLKFDDIEIILTKSEIIHEIKKIYLKYKQDGEEFNPHNNLAEAIISDVLIPKFKKDNNFNKVVSYLETKYKICPEKNRNDISNIHLFLIKNAFKQEIFNHGMETKEGYPVVTLEYLSFLLGHGINRFKVKKHYSGHIISFECIMKEDLEKSLILLVPFLKNSKDFNNYVKENINVVFKNSLSGNNILIDHIESFKLDYSLSIQENIEKIFDFDKYYESQKDKDFCFFVKKTGANNLEKEVLNFSKFFKNKEILKKCLYSNQYFKKGEHKELEYIQYGKKYFNKPVFYSF